MLKEESFFSILKKKQQVSSKGIIFLQETHSTKDIESQLDNDWNEKGHIKYSHGDYNARGVLISI